MGFDGYVASPQGISKPHDLSGKRNKKLKVHINLLPLKLSGCGVTCFIPCNPQYRLDHIEICF
jgi:hypothetical protein